MSIAETTKPKCPVFSTCGGCSYQDMSYKEQLQLKSEILEDLLRGVVTPHPGIQDVVASPREYHYRHRLDLKLKRTKDGQVFVGFTPMTGRGVVEVEQCPIAMEAVSAFIPQLKQEALAKLTPKYRQANLVVRTGEDGRVLWGGIGKKSLRLNPQEYFWVEINGRKIFYSLDTFFQANLSILPLLFESIKQLQLFDENTTFLDLYGGVGLFGIGLIDQVREVVIIENCKPSVEVARYNVHYHDLQQVEVIEGDVESHLPDVIDNHADDNLVAMIDPPRAGLSKESREFLVQQKGIHHMLYLSCNPEALARDLKYFKDQQWDIVSVIPFDFFPQTKHLETLVVMRPIANG